MKDPWPVFAVTDTITDCTDSDLADMKAGLYYIDRGFRMGRPEHIDAEYELEECQRWRIARRRGKDFPRGRGVISGGCMAFKAGWYPPSVIRRCIEHRYIERRWVTRKIVSQQSLPSRTFRKYVQKIYDEVGPGEAKYLINNLVGYLGKAYQRTHKGAVTTCALTAGATENQYTDRNLKVHITELNGVYFLKYETKTQLTEGHAALQMYIIGQSYVLLDDLVRKACGPDTVPVAFNTDAFKAINMRPLDFPETPTFGDIRKEAKVTVRVSRRRVAGVMRIRHDPEEDPELDKRACGAEDLLVRGGVVIGPAGSGKTTKLVELYNECKTAGKRVAVLTPTHGAKKNLCARGVTVAMTIDKYYGKVKGANVRINPLKACDEDVIFVDEFSMITYDWYHVFMQAKRAKPNLIFIFFGDDNQCDAVTQYKCRIVETSVMQFVGGYNLVRLPYIAATGRYTEETKVELDKLLNNGTWEHYQQYWPAVGVDIPFNIVFTNRLRRKLNQQACEAYCFALTKEDIVEIAGRKFAVGMPLVCFDNITALGFNNNDMFTITGFSEDVVLVRRGRNGKKQHKIERSWFSKKIGDNYVFEHYWASTVNRVQGITLQGKYNVHEIDIMPLNHLYTALSRTVDYKLVAVGEQRKADFVWREKPCSPQKMISPKKADLQGVIYRIDGGSTPNPGSSQWYVGKTVVRDGETYETAVVRRFKEHHDKPTCDKMREWLKSAKDATISVVKSGYFMSDYQLDRFETLVLTHESVVRTEGCMNTQKVVGIAPEIKIAKLGNESKQIAECVQAAASSKPAVSFDKLVSDGAIKIDPKKKRYRVSYIEGGKTKRKEFYYRDGTETGIQNVAVDFYKTMMKM